jgi:hypothetical protein
VELLKTPFCGIIWTLNLSGIYAARMEIYSVDLNEAVGSKYRRARVFLIVFACTTPIYFALEWFWPRHATPSVTGMVFQAIFFSLVMSAVQSSRTGWLSVSRSWANYQIVVEEDEITTRNFNSYNRMLSRTVRRTEIRTVVEKKQGLLISSRGRVATFFFGGIWIPKQLANYEDLQRLILNWRAKQSE